MPKMLTVELINRYTELTHVAERLSKDLGEPVIIRARRIGREEYLSVAPPNPPGSSTWKRGEFAKRFTEWFDALPREAREARTQQGRDVLYRVVAAASLPPLVCPVADCADRLWGRRLRKEGEVLEEGRPVDSLAEHLEVDHGQTPDAAEKAALRANTDGPTPFLTFDQARQLGTDGEEAGIEIMVASGIWQRAADAPKAADDAASSDAPGGAAASDAGSAALRDAA